MFSSPYLRVAILTACLTACSRAAPPKAADSDTSTVAAEAESVEDVSCKTNRRGEIGNAVVIVKLDSAAVKATSRLRVNIVKQEKGPVRARLQASTGSAECETAGRIIQFTVHNPQSFLGLTVYSPTEQNLVEVNRLEVMMTLASNAFPADQVDGELTWQVRNPFSSGRSP